MANTSNRRLLVEAADFSYRFENKQNLTEALQMSAGKHGTLIVRNIAVTILNRLNQNQRIYSTQVMQEAINEARKLGLFETKQMLSAGNEHPEASFVPPTEASHIVIDAYIKPKVHIVVEGKEEIQDVLFMDWEILNTQNGKNLRALFEAEASIGVSIRGIGELNGNQVANYSLCGCDCVGLPSSSTYTRMSVSESVKAEFVEGTEQNKEALKETFNVSTSSTNVVRDLEAAANIQEQLDGIGYGTVVKTSTKMDEETDPKTGAMTQVTTLEAETSDDVATLDQALSMAKNAMMNGVVSVDSVTIEAVKEETAKESKEDTSDNSEEKSLKEEDQKESEENVDVEYVPEDQMEEGIAGAILGGAAGSMIGHPILGAAAGSIAQDHFNNKKEESKKMTESKEKEEDPKAGRKFVLKAPAGYVAMDGNALVFKEDPKEALHFIVGKEESGLVHLSGVEKILDTMGVYDVEKHYRKEKPAMTDISEKPVEEGMTGALLGGAAGAMLGHPVLGAAAGSLIGDKVIGKKGDIKKNGWKSGALLGAALGSTVGMPLAGAAAGAGLQSMWKNKKESVAEGEENEDNSNTSAFTAQVTLKNDDGTTETENIPVASKDLQAMASEIGNLWDMKSQKTNNGVQIIVLNNNDGTQYTYEPANHTLVPMTEATNTSVQQDQNKLTVAFDDGTEVTKEFNDPAQAAVAKAGMEKGQISGDVMMDEGFMNMFPKKVQKFVRHIRGKDKYDYKPSEDPKYYIIFDNDFRNKEHSPVGSFDTADEAEAFMYGHIKKELWPRASFALVVNRYEESVEPVQEKLFSEPTPASDEFVEVPMEEEADNVQVTLTDIDWDTEAILNNFKSNAQPGDAATEGDIVSFINNLPETITVDIPADALASFKSKEDLLTYIKNQLSEKSGIYIISASIANTN